MEPNQKVSKKLGWLLVGIVIGFALVALYANVQKLRRPAIESVTFVPATTGTPTVTPTPTR